MSTDDQKGFEWWWTTNVLINHDQPLMISNKGSKCLVMLCINHYSNEHDDACSFKMLGHGDKWSRVAQDPRHEQQRTRSALQHNHQGPRNKGQHHWTRPTALSPGHRGMVHVRRWLRHGLEARRRQNSTTQPSPTTVRQRGGGFSTSRSANHPVESARMVAADMHWQYNGWEWLLMTKHAIWNLVILSAFQVQSSSPT